MLPDELFVSLIDTDLQERIAMADNLDGNAAVVVFKGPVHRTKKRLKTKLDQTD